MTETDWADHTTSTNKTTWVNGLNARSKNLLKQDFASDTSVPSGAIRTNPTTGVLEKYNGSSWATFQHALANNSYLTARNAAASGALDLIKADGSDNTIINTATGKQLILAIAGAAKWYLDSSGNLIPGADGSLGIGNTSYHAGPIYATALNKSSTGLLNITSTNGISLNYGVSEKLRITDLLDFKNVVTASGKTFSTYMKIKIDNVDKWIAIYV